MLCFAAPLLLGARATTVSNPAFYCYRRSLPCASLAQTRRYRNNARARNEDRRPNHDDRVEYSDVSRWDRQPPSKRRSMLDANNEEWRDRGKERHRRVGRRDARYEDRGSKHLNGRRDSRFEKYRGGGRNFDERRDERRGGRFEKYGQRERQGSRHQNYGGRSRNLDDRSSYRARNDSEISREQSFNSQYHSRSEVETGREQSFDNRHLNEQFDGEQNMQYERNERRWEGDRRRERTQEPSEVQKALASGDDLVYGLQSVKQALLAKRRKLYALYIQSTPGGSGGERKADNQRIRSEIERIAHSSSLRVVLLDRGELNALSSNRPHQGVILRCGALEYGPDTNTLSDPKSGDVLLALDEVQDPQNVGALLRSAAFLGARGVVVCARNSAPLTPVVSRASSGTAEIVEVTATDSMPRFLRRAREHGWRVLGAASGKGAVDIGEVESGAATVLVLGNEGDGLRTMVRNCCDACIEIGRSENAPEALDSLNVSVAGALAMFKLLR